MMAERWLHVDSRMGEMEAVLLTRTSPEVLTSLQVVQQPCVKKLKILLTKLISCSWVYIVLLV